MRGDGIEADMTITFAHVRNALSLPNFNGEVARLPMVPGTRALIPPAGSAPRDAAVLILIHPKPGAGLHLILTLRSERLRGHSGQVSFPGGRRDPEDFSYADTALRETCEELAICNRAQMQVLGELTPCYIPPSNYLVHPIVATTQGEPQPIANPLEVAAVFSMSLQALLDPATKHSETREFKGQAVAVPYYEVDGYKVWGATAIMLCELEARLRAVLPQPIQEEPVTP